MSKIKQPILEKWAIICPCKRKSEDVSAVLSAPHDSKNPLFLNKKPCRATNTKGVPVICHKLERVSHHNGWEMKKKLGMR